MTPCLFVRSTGQLDREVGLEPALCVSVTRVDAIKGRVSISHIDSLR
jgi:hypothetical protein